MFVMPRWLGLTGSDKNKALDVSDFQAVTVDLF